MKTLLLVSLILILSGCRSIPQNQVSDRILSLYSSCGNYQRFVDRESCIKKVASTDPLFSHEPELRKFIAYSAVLAKQVKANKMTDAEAIHAILLKEDEILKKKVRH